jgi:hypothetical protein
MTDALSTYVLGCSKALATISNAESAFATASINCCLDTLTARSWPDRTRAFEQPDDTSRVI